MGALLSSAFIPPDSLLGCSESEDGDVTCLDPFESADWYWGLVQALSLLEFALGQIPFSIALDPQYPPLQVFDHSTGGGQFLVACTKHHPHFLELAAMDANLFELWASLQQSRQISKHALGGIHHVQEVLLCRPIKGHGIVQRAKFHLPIQHEYIVAL